MDATSLSLIARMQAGSADAWGRLQQLYRPLVYATLRRYGVPHQEADDLTQDVMLVVVRKLADFSHSQQTGAFRSWLRKITANRALEFWRKGKIHPRATGHTDFGIMLEQLVDPASEQASQWDQEHDKHVVGRLLEMILADYELSTQQAFRRYVLDDAPPADVAQELGITVHAVYSAKSRVMHRLRQETAGLSDNFGFL